MTNDFQKCANRPECDGCPVFEQNPADSYAAKVAEVGEALERYALHAWPKPAATGQGRTLGYRNRARMMVTEAGRLGLYRAGSRDVLPIDKCVVHEPAVEAVLAKVRAAGVARGARNVDVRANEQGDAIVTFGVAELPAEDTLAALRTLAGPSLSVHVNVGDRETFLSGEQVPIEGAAALTMQVGGRSFEVPPAAFFQVNTEVLEQIHNVVRPWISGAPALWDLYCGMGVHGLACASPGQKVLGIDIDSTGIEAARRNAAALGIDATYEASSDDTFEPGDAEGHAILNPARAGLAWSLPAKLAAARIQRLAYISCEPRTFLRDAERLANEGFALRELHAFDMMPRTSHIELAGLFERAELPRHWEDLGDGIAGAGDGDGLQVWVALVDGTVPRQATLPGGDVRLERLRAVDGAAVVRLHAPPGFDADRLRELLKRWRHPVIGDDRGNRAANFRWRQAFDLDIPALHRVRCGGRRSPAPDFFLTLFRLPRDVVARAK